eukprot:SAG31_NODE_1338_length_8731_cov_14.189643_3_plen_180_part_00
MTVRKVALYTVSGYRRYHRASRGCEIIPYPDTAGTIEHRVAVRPPPEIESKHEGPPRPPPRKRRPRRPRPRPGGPSISIGISAKLAGKVAGAGGAGAGLQLPTCGPSRSRTSCATSSSAVATSHARRSGGQQQQQRREPPSPATRPSQSREHLPRAARTRPQPRCNGHQPAWVMPMTAR